MGLAGYRAIDKDILCLLASAWGGSGVGTVVAQRLKNSGMFWSCSGSLKRPAYARCALGPSAMPTHVPISPCCITHPSPIGNFLGAAPVPRSEFPAWPLKEELNLLRFWGFAWQARIGS
jgi:hypothetical protein